MNDTPTPTSLERAEKLQGMGCKRKRVEDVRFTQGKGNYVDDIKLPGMLHGDFHRSSHAHARIVKIDTSKAKAVPGVLAVLTAEDLKGVNLAWMPTLAGDVQMVLADGKVLFQNQEIAFIVATDRYIAADAADLVEVEYEALPVVVDPFKAMAPDAPVLREDIKDKKDGAHGPRKHHNHIFNWQVGDKELTDAAFAKAEVATKDLLSYQRVHPCPLETCQCVVSFNKITGDLTIYGTFQAPHVIRTVVSLIAPVPEHKIHVISPDIGGGFGNKVGAYPGYICAAVASIVTGLPVKWVEDRIENLSTTSFARDYHMTTEIAATRDGRVTGCASISSPITARSTPAPIRRNGRPASRTSSPAPTTFRSRIFRSTASTPTRRPGGVAYRCSFRVTEVAYAIERAMDIMAQKLGLDPGRLPDEELHQARAVPLSVRARLGIRFRRLSHRHAEGARRHRLPQAARGAEGEAGGVQARRDPRTDGDRRFLLHRDRRRRPVEELRHPRHRDVQFMRDPHPSDRQGDRAHGHQEPGPGPRDDLGPDHRDRDRHSPPTTSRSRKATPTPRPTASAPTARARRRSPAPRSPWRRARSRPRRR